MIVPVRPWLPAFGSHSVNKSLVKGVYDPRINTAIAVLDMSYDWLDAKEQRMWQYFADVSSTLVYGPASFEGASVVTPGREGTFYVKLQDGHTDVVHDYSLRYVADRAAVPTKMTYELTRGDGKIAYKVEFEAPYVFKTTYVDETKDEPLSLTSDNCELGHKALHGLASAMRLERWRDRVGHFPSVF